ncbi:unnamed protein product [Alopecurus aequalis]
MPMAQKKRRRRSRRPLSEGFSRRRLGEDGVSLAGSSVDSDSSITTSSVDGGSPPAGLSDEPATSSTNSRYHQFIASRLALLKLPAAADDNPDSADLSKLPSIEIVEALTRKSFYDDDLRAALVEYQCHNFKGETQGSDIQGRDRDSGESDSEPGNAIPRARRTPIDTYTELDQEQIMELHLKHALYHIKAALLLKGKPVGELDVAALERKFPPELIVENDYFFHYVDDGYFGWYFDPDLCYKKFLSDYQRLVLLNDGDEYSSWSRYREFYCTPEADREYLQYWKNLVKKMEWLEQHVLKNPSSYEWSEIHSEATLQAANIVAELPNVTMELAGLGLKEYIWITRTNLMFYKYLDGIFYEIWMRINKDNQLRFRDALKQVYDDKLFTEHDRHMKNELEYGGSNMDRLFFQCTKGLSEKIPEYRARELIAQEIRWRRGMQGSYEGYARKKLKIAELIGLIPKDKRASCVVL